MSLFNKTVAEMANGKTLAELDAALQQVTLAVRATGKKGKLTLEIEMKPFEAESDMVTLKDNIKVSLPTVDRPRAILYTTDDGTLQRHDPKQPELKLEVVPPEEEPIQIPKSAVS